jgi:hypothetical protein
VHAARVSHGFPRALAVAAGPRGATPICRKSAGLPFARTRRDRAERETNLARLKPTVSKTNPMRCNDEALQKDEALDPRARGAAPAGLAPWLPDVGNVPRTAAFDGGRRAAPGGAPYGYGTHGGAGEPPEHGGYSGGPPQSPQANINTLLPVVLNAVAAVLCCVPGLGVSLILSAIGLVIGVQGHNAKHAGDYRAAAQKAKTSLLLAGGAFAVGLFGGLVHAVFTRLL